MKALVVDDDFSSRLILQSVLQEYGEVHVAVNGAEAIDAAKLAMEQGNQYDLICLDIMMPDVDGHAALEGIRKLEDEHGVLLGKGAVVIMTTALGDSTNFFGAFREQCDHYLTKPINTTKLTDYLRSTKLIA